MWVYKHAKVKDFLQITICLYNNVRFLLKHACTLTLLIDGLLSQRVVIDLLAVCRSTVGHFKHSSVVSHKLARIQENLDLSQHTLKQDVSTRWNSILYMIQSILERKMALATYAAKNDSPQLTASQLEIAWKITLVLAPIEDIAQTIFN